MEIAEWLKKTETSLLTLAKKAKVAPASLYAIYSHRRGLSESLASKVSKATKGEVSMADAMKPPKKRFKDARGAKEVRKFYCCDHCGKEIDLKDILKKVKVTAWDLRK